MTAATKKKSRWRRIDKRVGHINNIALKLGLWVLILTGLVLLWKEYHREQFLIDPIEVPTSFAAQGIKPTVAAQRIYDEINNFQNKVTSVRSASGYSTQQRMSNVDFQVAGFGLSIQSLANQLRNVAGKTDRSIRGEIIQGVDSVSLRLRWKGQTLAQIREVLLPNREETMNKLALQAAEKLFAETEPYLYAVHVSNTSPFSESLPVAQRLLTIPEEKKWGLNLIGSIYSGQNQMEKAIKYFSKAEKEDQSFPLAKRNLAYVYKSIDSVDLALSYFDNAIRLSDAGITQRLMSEQYFLLKKHYPNDPKLVSIEAQFNQMDNAQFLGGLSASLANNFLFSDAYLWAEKAYQLDPENPMVLSLYATFSCAFQYEEKCAKCLEFGKDSDPNNENLIRAKIIQSINQQEITRMDSMIAIVEQDSNRTQGSDIQSMKAMQSLLHGDSLKAKNTFLTQGDSSFNIKDLKQLKFLEPLFAILPDSLQ